MPFLYNTTDCWQVWTNCTQTATTTAIWDQWITTNTTSTATNCYISHEITREEHEQMMARRRAAEKQLEERQIAFERAKELLMSMLTEEQRRDVRERNCFHVRSRSGRRYRINTGCVNGNVERLNEAGLVAERFCAHDREHGTPWPDQHLAQKFYLEHHEDEFLRIANRH